MRARLLLPAVLLRVRVSFPLGGPKGNLLRDCAAIAFFTIAGNLVSTGCVS